METTYNHPRLEENLVHSGNIAQYYKSLGFADKLGIDVETTGLHSFKGDSIFSIAVALDCGDLVRGFYFDFRHKPKLKNHVYNLLDGFKGTIYAHHAKFDGHMLYKEGLNIFKHPVLDTKVGGRIARNDLMNYTLASLAKRIKLEKKDIAKEWMRKNGATSKEQREGKKTAKTNFHFDKLPWEINMEYNIWDAYLALVLGKTQEAKISRDSEKIILLPNVSKMPIDILETEMKLTPVLFHMEQAGIRIDSDYTKKAIKHYAKDLHDTYDEISEMVGAPFVDSAKYLKPAFDKLDEIYPETAKGNPSFNKDALAAIDSPLSSLVTKHRKLYRLCNGYLQDFLYFQDYNRDIHCSFDAAGAATGRLSATGPALQTIPKRGEENAAFPIRRCFVPREGYNFAMIDYDQMEYRVMADIAQETKLINAILHDGLDVHTATSELVGVNREMAKAVNFLCIYGGGAAVLAMKLFKPKYSEIQLKAAYYTHIGYECDKFFHKVYDKMSFMERENCLDLVLKAKEIQNEYFAKLPKVRSLIKRVSKAAEDRRWIISNKGRMLHCPIKDFSYKMPNYYIQGSCADIMKEAMVKASKYLIDVRAKTRLLLTVHDELICEYPVGEEHHLIEIRNIMTRAYTHKSLPLTAGIDISSKSWFDKEEL